MTNASKNALLEAAARKLAWEIYGTANYCRQRHSVNVEKFDRELSSAAKQWRTTRNNLKKERTERSRKNGTSKP